MRGSAGKHVPTRVVAMTFAAWALSVVALLLWGRLKLVTGVPRTAYADPRQVATPPKTTAEPSELAPSSRSERDRRPTDSVR